MRRFLFAGLNALVRFRRLSLLRVPGHREWTFAWPSGGSRPHNDMSKTPRTDLQTVALGAMPCLSTDDHERISSGANGRVFVSVRCPQTDMPSVFTTRASAAPTQAPGVMKWR